MWHQSGKISPNLVTLLLLLMLPPLIAVAVAVADVVTFDAAGASAGFADEVGNCTSQ